MRPDDHPTTALVGSTLCPEGQCVSLLSLEPDSTERWDFNVPHKTTAAPGEAYWCWPDEIGFEA